MKAITATSQCLHVVTPSEQITVDYLYALSTCQSIQRGDINVHKEEVINLLITRLCVFTVFWWRHNKTSLLLLRICCSVWSLSHNIGILPIDWDIYKDIYKVKLSSNIGVLLQLGWWVLLSIVTRNCSNLSGLIYFLHLRRGLNCIDPIRVWVLYFFLTRGFVWF